MNSRKSAFLASALVCLCLCGLLVSPASAGSYIGAGDVEIGPGGPVQSWVNLLSTIDGNIYSNTITSADPTIVNTVRAIGAIPMTNYLLTTGGFATAAYSGNPISLVFAIEGTSTPTGGGGQLFNATGGRLGLFTFASGTFIAHNPTTWGAVTGSVAGGDLALASPIAVWDLKPAEDIFDFFPGPGIFTSSAANVNQIAVNTEVVTDAQGTFLFRETTTYSGPTELSGNDFWTTTQLAWPFPPNYEEIMAVALGEKLNLTPNLSIVSTTEGLGALNKIGDVLGDYTSLGGTSFFATGFGSANVTDYDPFHVTLNPTGSDNVFVGNIRMGGGIQVIPEPGSVALFAMILGGAGVVAGWRRRRARVGS